MREEVKKKKNTTKYNKKQVDGFGERISLNLHYCCAPILPFLVLNEQFINVAS